jgi:hypothetical protein
LKIGSAGSPHSHELPEKLEFPAAGGKQLWLVIVGGWNQTT